MSSGIYDADPFAEIMAAVGVSELAELIGVSRQTIHNWRSGRVVISAEMAVRIEAAVGIPRERLRPDLYRREIDGEGTKAED